MIFEVSYSFHWVKGHPLFGGLDKIKKLFLIVRTVRTDLLEGIYFCNFYVIRLIRNTKLVGLM